jgi:hypothetical protein
MKEVGGVPAGEVGGLAGEGSGSAVLAPGLTLRGSDTRLSSNSSPVGEV